MTQLDKAQRSLTKQAKCVAKQTQKDAERAKRVAQKHELRLSCAQSRYERYTKRHELRLKRLQLRHEQNIKKIESGYYHQRAEEIAKVGKPLAEAVGQNLGPVIRTALGLLKFFPK